MSPRRSTLPAHSSIPRRAVSKNTLAPSPNEVLDRTSGRRVSGPRPAPGSRRRSIRWGCRREYPCDDRGHYNADRLPRERCGSGGQWPGAQAGRSKCQSVGRRAASAVAQPGAPSKSRDAGDRWSGRSPRRLRGPFVGGGCALGRRAGGLRHRDCGTDLATCRFCALADARKQIS